MLKNNQNIKKKLPHGAKLMLPLRKLLPPRKQKIKSSLDSVSRAKPCLSALSLNTFGLAFNKNLVLSSVTLDIPITGIMVLMGPSGTGKSSLLRAICGACLTNPAHRTWGTASYVGIPLFDSGVFPSLVSQNIQLMMSSVLENIINGLPERGQLTIAQQTSLAKRLLNGAGLSHLCSKLRMPATELALADMRHLAILRQTASNPKLLCVDEPTAGLEDKDAQRITQFLIAESKKRAIFIATHNKQLAMTLGGRTALLAGGWIQEEQKTEFFFTQPKSKAAKIFVATGSCPSPSPDAKPEELAPEWASSIQALPKEADITVNQALGPKGFLWLKNGCLAGTPRPGLLLKISQDLSALKRVGITDLISLTQTPLDIGKCREYDINISAFPIDDMRAPSMQQALKICKKITQLLKLKKSVAIHCKAGLGRTGTLLAAQLIFEGNSALTALEIVRKIQARWVQSEEQVSFLSEFEDFIFSMLETSVINA